VQEELGRWLSVPAEEVGLVVSMGVDDTVLLSLWLVELSAGRGERKMIILPIAAKRDGTRVSAIERQVHHCLRAPAAAAKLSPDDRLILFARVVEPTLQRELKHKGTANGDGSYSADLVGYVEIVSSPS